MGNSEKVGREHYLQVTDEHFHLGASAGRGKIGGKIGGADESNGPQLTPEKPKNSRKHLKRRRMRLFHERLR